MGIRVTITRETARDRGEGSDQEAKTSTGTPSKNPGLFDV